MDLSNHKEVPDIVIPRDKAVFWLDKDGFWHNEGGRFELKKIIRRFHSSIELDEGGYYVTQLNDDRVEKVYFPYEDTALFAIDVEVRKEMIMRLNTGKRLPLSPERIYYSEDSLYTVFRDEWIKFSVRSLLKLSPFIDYESNPWLFCHNGKSHIISNKPAHP